MSNGSFQMSDREFWEQPAKAYDKAYEETVLERKPGFLIDAPEIVDFEGRSSIPVPVFYAMKQKDSWGIELLRDGVIVASRLEDRGCWAGTVRKMTGEDDETLPDPASLLRPSGPPPKPDKIEEQFVVANLRETPQIPWERGTYEARVLIRDQVSNAVRSVIQDPPPPFNDPEVAKFLAARKAPPPAPAPVSPKPAVPFPSYVKEEDSPEIPAEVGISFSLPRVVILELGARAIVKLSFRLAEMPGDVVLPAVDPITAMLVEPVASPPTAIVPLHLLLTGSLESDPALLHLRVPVWDSIDENAPGAREVTGHVTLDLFQLYPPLMQGKAQTFFVYAISGEIFEGPVLMALVTTDMLPR